jgi:hypothetical protein
MHPYASTQYAFGVNARISRSRLQLFNLRNFKLTNLLMHGGMETIPLHDRSNCSSVEEKLNILKKFDSNRTLFLRSNICSVGNTIEEQPSLDTLEFAGGGNESYLGCDETSDSFIGTLDGKDCTLQPLRKRYRKILQQKNAT